MSNTSHKPPRRHSRCREAYLRCLPELRAPLASEPLEADIEVDEAVSTALNAMPNVRVVRPLLTQLDGVDMRLIDNVESYALAAAFTHFRFVASVGGDLAALVESARDQRTQLSDAVAALPAHARGAESTPETPDDLAYDILWRAELARAYLHEALPEQKALKTALEVVIEAELQAEEILASLNASQDGLPHEQLRDERARAFALFIEAYENHVRPAVAKLFRRKHDVEAMAHAYAFQTVADELGPEALSLLGPERGPFGAN